MGLPLENIIQMQEFTACPDEPFIIGVSQVIFLMPIFKLQCEHWVDATGDYDLCMSLDGLKYEFTNRLSTTEKFAYRYISVFYLSNRLGRPR